MALFGKLFRVSPAKGRDPISDELKREENDPVNWDERWWLLCRKLETIFEGRGFAESEDLAMEVMVILITRGHSIGDPNTFYSALNIARKLSLEEWRRLTRSALHDQIDEFVEGTGSASTQHTDLEDGEYKRTRAHCFEEALNKLPPKDRWLFMTYRNCIDSGVTADECAERIGMNKQTLKNKASLLLLKVRSYARRCIKNSGY